jgi:hypothetical protein
MYYLLGGEEAGSVLLREEFETAQRAFHSLSSERL